MRIDFEPVAHSYVVDGRAVPSVTSLIRGAHDFAGVPEQVLEFARERGSAVHRAIDLDVQGVLDVGSLDERIVAYFRRWREFMHETKFVPFSAELQVASARYGYAGTLDLYGELPARPHRIAVIDTKCTETLPFTVGAQTAAYARALAETTGIDPACIDRYALRLSPSGYRLVQQKNPRDWPFFVAALTLRNCLNDHGK